MSRTTELFAAMSKAQGAFPIIPKDKTVKVTMKSGGTYVFAYAPLDTILNAVRQPLAENGLAVFQTIKKESLVTIVAHCSGGCLTLAPVRIQAMENGPQALGSALTYARRYSLTLALGIVSDDDDDANGASGNKVEKARKEPAERSEVQAVPPNRSSKELTESQAKYFPRAKAALDALHGTDKAAKQATIKAHTAMPAKGEYPAREGIEDYRSLDGKRIEYLTHALEALVTRKTKEAGHGEV
jgi:hypothetical protein